MRFAVFLLLIVGLAVSSIAQTAAAPTPFELKDPRSIFAAATPYYNFNDPALKPWCLKATYQIYDDEGKPGEQGTFEYWWASPGVYRSSWTRPGASYTDWHTADGKHTYKTSGETLNFFENRLQSALLSPLPESGDLDPAKFRLDREDKKLGAAKFPCIMVIPIMPQHGHGNRSGLSAAKVLIPEIRFSGWLRGVRFRSTPPLAPRHRRLRRSARCGFPKSHAPEYLRAAGSAAPYR